MNLEILNFEEHVQSRRKLDSFGIGKTKSFVIVQHSVHVFDPNRVHWAVEDNPFTIFRSRP